MTREEILAMEPGRELDKLVFIFVMGGRIPEPPLRARIMNFSSDISASWEVVENMQKTNLVRLSVNEGDYICKIGGDLLCYTSFGKTMPEAICKAALLAILPGEE